LKALGVPGVLALDPARSGLRGPFTAPILPYVLPGLDGRETGAPSIFGRRSLPLDIAPAQP